jgi:FixJ family two-component response regulator
LRAFLPSDIGRAPRDISVLAGLFRSGRAELRVLRDRHASLTPREREIMALVVSGLLNKQIAAELGISEITVKAHRGRVMRKMQVDSLADLVRVAAALDVSFVAHA